MENDIIANFAVVTTVRVPQMQARNSLNDLAHGNDGGVKAVEVGTDMVLTMVENPICSTLVAGHALQT